MAIRLEAYTTTYRTTPGFVEVPTTTPQAPAVTEIELQRKDGAAPCASAFSVAGGTRLSRRHHGLAAARG